MKFLAISLPLAVVLVCLGESSASALEPAATQPRERFLINDNWRFTQGDPTNVSPKELLYDVRPVARGDDQRERLAEATSDAEKLAAASHPVLKPWILPSGNAFIKDPARHFTRPDGNPGSEFAYEGLSPRSITIAAKLSSN